jgi:hypothetical protein
MKTLFSLFALSVSVAFGQQITVTKAEYQNLKQSGLINPNAQYSFSDQAFPSNIKYVGSAEKNGLCDCMVPLDSTFTLAMLPNDDESSELINLPFTFDFYGNQYNALYINNNGNISFVSPYITWTSNSFPDSTYNMIAPFWGDVDTRGGMDSLGNFIGNGGSVWYKITPSALIVNWNQVGYFNMHSDLVSTFQLIISNGADSLISAGGNVSFCYQDMQWTTGDASGGFGGFGGSPSTVGVNVGNGVDFFQVGQFDQTGTNFDGPVNNNDGIDFLDGQEIYFNVAGINTSNTPPLLVSSAICDTIDVYTGDTLQKSINAVEFSIGVMTPEVDQTITMEFNSNAPENAFSFQINNLGNQFYNINASFDATGVAPGIYIVNLTARDNGTPVGITTKQFIFNVKYDASLGSNELASNDVEIYPNPTNDKVNFVLKNQNTADQIVIQDLSGKIMITQHIGNDPQIDLSELSNGIYLITFYSNNQVVAVDRVIKE